MPPTWSPAPYGGACKGCSQAKCKCFYRPDEQACERCQRLQKTCEPPARSRKRKSPPDEQPPDGPALPLHMPTPKDSHTTPSTSTTLVDLPGEEAHLPHPDLFIDTDSSNIRLMRPVETTANASLGVVSDDVSVHDIPNKLAEEQLARFRKYFLSLFPFVYIPDTMTAFGLRGQKPFLWLVIMALTTKSIAQQFQMEETIWKVISRRVVTQHYADLDLISGIVCFASWSQFFKKDKPFMVKLSDLALSLIYDLHLNRDAVSKIPPRRYFGKQSQAQPRTLEQRRAFVAVYHLTSATWLSYKKAPPLAWTPYLEECIQTLSLGKESDLDILLSAQARCQNIQNQLVSPVTEESVKYEGSESIKSTLLQAMLSQIEVIPRDVPAHLGSKLSVQLYLQATELSVREYFLGRPGPPSEGSVSTLQRVQDLDSILTSAEKWLALFHTMQVLDLVGITVDIWTQFTHCLVVVFNLCLVDEPGWSAADVRKRVDVIAELDRFAGMADKAPQDLGLVDMQGPRLSLYYKTSYMARAVKSIFLEELGQGLGQGAPDDAAPGYPAIDAAGSDYQPVEFTADLSEMLENDAWIADIFTPWGNTGTDLFSFG